MEESKDEENDSAPPDEDLALRSEDFTEEGMNKENMDPNK